VATTGIPDNYRAHQGVSLPTRFPPDFPKDTASRIDLNGDGQIRGWGERKAASLFFAKHFPNLARRPLPRSVSHFLSHLVLVDEPAQAVTVYGVRVNLESEEHLDAETLFKIGDALIEFPAGRVREAFHSRRPLRVVVAKKDEWFRHARTGFTILSMFVQFNVIPLFETAFFIGGLEAYDPLENTLYLTQYTRTEEIIHGFAHVLTFRDLVERKAEKPGDDYPDLMTGRPDKARIVDKAVQPGLGCKDGQIDTQTEHVHSYLRSEVCLEGEAMSYISQVFFTWENELDQPYWRSVWQGNRYEAVQKTPRPFDRWMDTVFRRFVDSGMKDYAILRDNPYVPEQYKSPEDIVKKP